MTVGLLIAGVRSGGALIAGRVAPGGWPEGGGARRPAAAFEEVGAPGRRDLLLAMPPPTLCRHRSLEYRRSARRGVLAGEGFCDVSG